MSNEFEPKPEQSQNEHTPKQKAVVIAIGMVIGLVLLYLVITFAGRPPAAG